MHRPEELNISRLGTREYWDQIYLREAQNYIDHQDEGEIWFGEDSEDKIVDYLQDNLDITSTTLTCIDLGTGNGHLLFRLRDEGFQWNLCGLDYSHGSVDLAKSIAQQRGCNDIRFKVSDFMKDFTLDKADLILDKGTFDAISLCDVTTSDGKRLFETYASAVVRLMKASSLLLITSCNWTQEELIKWMTMEHLLVYDSHVKRPKFTFGGASGTTVATVAFRLPLSDT